MSPDPTELLAAGLVGAAVWLATPPSPRRLLAARLGPSLRRARLGAVATKLVTAASSVRSAGGPVTAIRRRRPDEITLVVEACDVIALELRAGRPPAHALAAAAEVLPALEPAATAAWSGTSVAEALRALEGVDPDARRSLGAAWAVAEKTGAGPAAVAECVVQTLRSDDAVRREVAIQLAGPRGTARLLAMLPLLGLVIGAGFGEPMAFLFGTPYGWVCLVLGVLLAGAGVCWIEWLARRAEQVR